MAAKGTRKFQRELHAGISSLLLLSAVRHSPMYVYQIAKHLEAKYGQPLPMKLGALYPVLDSLENQGLVASRKEASETGPPRRYFRITARGRTALAEWTDAWIRIRDLVDSVTGGNDA